MFRQLAKMASTPPSPKKRACRIRAVLTAIQAAHGPRTTAISVPPTPWAVVPPGTGTLNIMIVKLSAEKIASSGTVRLFRTFLTFWVATAQVGTVATARPIDTAGARYPSGMCTDVLLSYRLTKRGAIAIDCASLRVYAGAAGAPQSTPDGGPTRDTSQVEPGRRIARVEPMGWRRRTAALQRAPLDSSAADAGGRAAGARGPRHRDRADRPVS